MAVTVRSVSYATSAQNEPIVVARPTGVQQGDLLIAVYVPDGSLSGASASGWTTVASYATSATAEAAVRIYRRTASSAEPSTYTFKQTLNANGTVHVVCISGADVSAAPKVAFADSTGDRIVTPSVTPAAATAVEIRAAAWTPPPFLESPTLTPPAGYTARGTIRTLDGLFNQVSVATRQVSSSAPTGPKAFTWNLEGLAGGIGVSISVASEQTAPQVDPPPPLTPGRGSSLYRYVLRTLDGTYLDDLDLVGVSFDKRIGQAGSFGATIPIPSRKVADRVARVIPRGVSELGIGPGVITCEIYRNGVCWGEYWITGAQISGSRRGTPAISLRGSTIDALMMQVEMQEELEYSGDQIDIARALLSQMEGIPHASLDLVVQAGTSGVSRDFLYKPYEATYGQRLTELAELDNGFEWTIDIVSGGSGLERRWVWGYPTLGGSEVEHVFGNGRYGGDILDWSEEIDALRGATSWRARGGSDPNEAADASTETTALLSAAHEATAHLAAGWPLINRTVTYSSVTEAQALEDYAAYWAAAASGALRVDSITVALGAQPTFTPTSLGDQARIYLDNEWHLPHSRVRRIIGVGITPVSRDTGKEEAQLIFEGLEVADGG